MQEAAIPPLLAGRDLLAEAPTGTGKTAAFALPILQRLAVDGLGRAEAGTALALVLVPTRELAMQVAEAVHRYGRVLGARVLPVYGGQPIGQQLRGPPAWARRRRRDARPSSRSPDPREPPPRRRGGGDPRRGRRDARHGLRRGARHDPLGHPGRPPDRALLGHDLAHDRPRGVAPPARARPRLRASRPTVRGDPGQGPPAGLRRAPHRQARGTGKDPRRRGPCRRARVRPDARRGRRPGRGAQRARARCRRPPRRPVAGAARPRDGPIPRRRPRRVSGDRRSSPGAGHRARLARRQLRRPLVAGRLRAPDRADRARRPRGHGDHPGGATRAPAPPEHRVVDAGRGSSGRRCPRSPTCANVDSSCCGRACANAWPATSEEGDGCARGGGGARPRPLSRRRRGAGRRVRRGRDRAGRDRAARRARGGDEAEAEIAPAFLPQDRPARPVRPARPRVSRAHPAPHRGAGRGRLRPGAARAGAAGNLGAATAAAGHGSRRAASAWPTGRRPAGGGPPGGAPRWRLGPPVHRRWPASRRPAGRPRGRRSRRRRASPGR